MEQTKLNYAHVYSPNGDDIEEGYFKKCCYDGCMIDITFTNGDRYRVHVMWVVLEHRDL